MKPAHFIWVLGTAGIFLTGSTVRGAGTFVGTFKTEELTLELRSAAESYTGTVKLGERSFPLTATEKDGVLAGWFLERTNKFTFSATLCGETLTFTTDGTTYRLARQTAGGNPLAKPPVVNPLAKPEAASTPTPGGRANQPSGGPSAGAAWKTYRHPTGLSMSYPPDWQLKEHAQMLQMVPADAGSNADGPTEAYLVFAEAAEEIKSIEDARVMQFLDGQLGQLAPFLKRGNEPEAIRAGAAPGILATWEGQNPKGMKVRAHAFATLLKGYGVVLVGLGDERLLAGREKTLRGIFASFAAGQGQRDPLLVGTWKYWHYSSSALGGFSTERTRFLLLRADGTCSWSSRSESSGSVRGTDSLGTETWSAGMAGASTDSDRGTWSAGNAKLYVMWQNGSLSEWSYTISGQNGQRRLLLRGADQREPDEWMEEAR